MVPTSDIQLDTEISGEDATGGTVKRKEGDGDIHISQNRKYFHETIYEE